MLLLVPVLVDVKCSRGNMYTFDSDISIFISYEGFPGGSLDLVQFDIDFAIPKD